MGQFTSQPNRKALRVRGPTLSAKISVPAKARAYGPGAPSSYDVEGLALVDTGADRTCISLEAVKTLGLVGNFPVAISSPSGPAMSAAYTVDLSLPGTEIEVKGIQVVGAYLAGQGIEVLIGRDILERAKLVYDGHAGVWSMKIPWPESKRTAKTSQQKTKDKARKKMSKKSQRKNRRG